jgi:glycosyltransferase involved in cell wall biosynthesis
MNQREPVTVVFVDHGEGLGGAELFALEVMRALDRSRFRPVLACDSGPLETAARADDLETRVVSLRRMRHRMAAPVSLWQSTHQLWDVVRHERVRIVHSMSMRASFAAALAARLARQQFVWHAHDFFGAGHIGGRWYPRLMAGLAHAVIANSRAVALTIPRSDTRIIYSGIEVDRFEPTTTPAAARARLGLPETGLLIGTVGRMQPWKGHHLFLQMARQVSERLPGARFVIVGGRVFEADAGYEQELHRLASELGVAERVIFAGQQSDVAPWFAAMDIFVHCSTAEPFGRVVVEAMAAGRPVVAFADGGVPEIVVEGETGRLVAPGDVAQMAAAAVAVGSNSQLRAQLGHAGHQRSATMFSPGVHVRQIEALYDEILSGRPHADRP